MLNVETNEVCLQPLNPLNSLNLLLTLLSELYNVDYLFNVFNFFYRQNCLTQMLTLEHRTFKGPFERIWLSLLRLCFDPYEEVSSMCLVYFF